MNLLNATQTAAKVGISINTLNTWYRFKVMYPNNKYSKILPNYSQKGERQTRYWKESDIQKLIEFQKTIPKGRSGILSAVRKERK